jgi:hypothetical protein
MFNFDETNKKSKEAVDTFVKGYANVAQGFQAIATETADYSKKSFENGLRRQERRSRSRTADGLREVLL